MAMEERERRKAKQNKKNKNPREENITTHILENTLNQHTGEY